MLPSRHRYRSKTESLCPPIDFSEAERQVQRAVRHFVRSGIGLRMAIRLDRRLFEKFTTSLSVNFLSIGLVSKDRYDSLVQLAIAAIDAIGRAVVDDDVRHDTTILNNPFPCRC